VSGAWDLWLDCLTVREIEDATGIPKSTVNDAVSEFGRSAVFGQPPASRQHLASGAVA
jgi:hypothetical protein